MLIRDLHSYYNGNGPGGLRAGAGPENPGSRALQTQTGLKNFLFKSPFCNGKLKFC